MSKLIEELKKEHGVIASTLDKIRELKVTSKEGQKKLIDAKAGLLAHLEKEDKQLYPTLKSAAEKDANLKRMLDMFAQDMNGISQAALAFFENYTKGGSGIEFAKDFGRLFATLKQRISKEEGIIYKKFNEL